MFVAIPRRGTTVRPGLFTDDRRAVRLHLQLVVPLPRGPEFSRMTSSISERILLFAIEKDIRIAAERTKG